MRSIHIQKDKAIFKLSELPAEAFAASLGLPGAPQIKLLDGKVGGKVKERGGARIVEVMKAGVNGSGLGGDEYEVDDYESVGDGQGHEDRDEGSDGGEGSDSMDGSPASDDKISGKIVAPSKVSCLSLAVRTILTVCLAVRSRARANEI
jgi:ATP-dependent RNA helicase DDX10/DBP4